MVTAHAYRDVEEFWDDIVAAFQQELRSLAAAGCAYVQIDETAFAKFGDPDVRAALHARGDDPDALIDRYIAVTNRAIRDLPGLRIGMHLCRGNRGGQWHAEGSYEAVAEKLFNALDIGFFFLEYDTPARRRFLAAAVRAEGQVGRARPRLDQDEFPRRQSRAQAAHRRGEPVRPTRTPRHQPTMRLRQHRVGQSDQPEMQEAKLRLVVELAQEVWGTA